MYFPLSMIAFNTYEHLFALKKIQKFFIKNFYSNNANFVKLKKTSLNFLLSIRI